MDWVAFEAITTTAFILYTDAAMATPWAWLPADEQITPRWRCSAVR